jgi:hypothetical protein
VRSQSANIRTHFSPIQSNKFSLSTVAVLGNTVARPPQNSFNIGKREPTTLHASSKEMAELIVEFNIDFSSSSIQMDLSKPE